MASLWVRKPINVIMEESRRLASTPFGGRWAPGT